MKHAAIAFDRLALAPAVWVTVASAQGSVPRDAGTWMAVFADAVVGTIGGGHVEFQAIALARRRLAGEAGAFAGRAADRRWHPGVSLVARCASQRSR